MDWKDVYQRKLMSVEDAAKLVESNEKWFSGAIVSCPFTLMEAVAANIDSENLSGIKFLSGLTMYPLSLIDSKFVGKVEYEDFFLGPLRSCYKFGMLSPNSINLSQLSNLVRDNFQPDGMLAEVTPPDEDGYMYWGPTGVCVNGHVAEITEKIVVQVSKNQKRAYGSDYDRIHVSQVTAICEAEHLMVELPVMPISDIEKRIADYIVPFIPDGATLQLGIGGISGAIGFELCNKKNLSIWTEMFTNSMMELMKCGAVTGPVTTGFAFGDEELMNFIEDRRIKFNLQEIANNPTLIGANDNMVSINSTLMSDLTGQLCSESIGHAQYSSTGGQLDYTIGAWLSEGGQSFICLPSTRTLKDGTVISSILVNLPQGAVVTTPRSMVMNVVTEYGIANLKNCSIKERIQKMIEISHPDFRESLRKEAIEAGLIFE